MTDAATVVRNAFYDAQKRRPYAADAAILKAIVPPGGEWRCVAQDGAICRSVMSNGTEVAYVNPQGSLDDETEGQIAMALRSTPALDAGLRAIIVLAENADNIATIRTLAESLVAYIEQPAPRLVRPSSDDEDEPDDEDYES